MNRTRLTVAALAALSALVVLAPVLGAPSERMLGLRFVDGFGTQWWFWYAGEVMAGRESLDHTDLLFWPTGKDVFAHTGGNLLDGFLAWPFRAVFGPVFGYTLWCAAVVVSNFYAGRHLGAAFTGREGWPAGLLLAMNPYTLDELAGGRPTQAWVALPALALVGVWSGRGPWGAVLTGLAVAATGWVYWYGGVMLGILAVGLGLLRLARGPERLRSLAVLVGAALVAGAAVAPAAVWMQEALGSGSVPGLLALTDEGPLAPLAMRTVEGDAAGLQVLEPLSGRAGRLVDDDGLRFVPDHPSLSFAGLGFALVSLVLALRERRWALVMAALGAGAVTLLVAAGPAISYPGGLLRNEPWLAVVPHVDLLRRWWWPARAIFGVYLALALLLPLLGTRRWLAPGFAFALAVELSRTGNLPIPTWDAREPPSLACLRSAPDGAVIDLPYLSDQHNLWYQTLHRKPILSGMLVKKAAFGSGPALALRESNPYLDLLLDLGDLQLTRDLSFDPAHREALVTAGYRYVVVDLTRMEGAAAGKLNPRFGRSLWPRLRRVLLPVLGEPFAEDERVAVYALGSEAPACP